jgi:hypothetical protein
MVPELMHPALYSAEVEAERVGKVTKKNDLYALAITAWKVSLMRALSVVLLI